MLLIDNFVHADLHPGNIMVRFYRPEKSTLSDLATRFRPSPSPKTPAASAPNSPTASPGSADSPTSSPTSAAATEAEAEAVAVLARLRPLLDERDPAQRRAAWTAALAALDAAGWRPQLVFIDTGLVTQLSSANRRNFLDLFRAVAEGDGARAGELMVARCRTPGAVRAPDEFALRVHRLVQSVRRRAFALARVRVGDVLAEVLSAVRRHRVRLEGDFVNVVISVLLLEGIGRSLDPELDLFKR